MVKLTILRKIYTNSIEKRKENFKIHQLLYK